jgi:hypothetical protein
MVSPRSPRRGGSGTTFLIVGDPETVVDRRGWTPTDRRRMSLTMFSARRSVRVRELRAKIPELTAALKTVDDRAERAKHRNTLHAAQRELDGLLAIPPLTADDMCSECATPYAKHGWSTPPSDGPCHAWPRWATRLAQATRDIVYSSVRSAQICRTQTRRTRAAGRDPVRPTDRRHSHALATPAAGAPRRRGAARTRQPLGAMAQTVTDRDGPLNDRECSDRVGLSGERCNWPGLAACPPGRV